MEINFDISQATEDIIELDDRLLVLRLDLGKLEASLERAFAPITATVVPMLNTAVRALTDFVNGAGQVISALFGQVQTETVKTTKVTSGAVKGALADFDRLDRLSLGSGSSTVTVTVPGELKAIPERFQQIADRIREILRPLQEIDLSAACGAFEDLQAAVTPLTRSLFSGLEWVWFNLLTPMAAWGAEQALPAFLNTLSAGMGVLSAAVGAAKPLLSWLWTELLKPLGQWAGQTLLSALTALEGHLNSLSQWLTGLQPKTESFTGCLSGLREGFAALCSGFGLFNSQYGMLGTGLGLLAQLAQSLGLSFQTVASAVDTVRQRVSGLLTALTPGFKAAANALIGVVNTALGAIEGVINSMVSILNSIRIDIPNWVPGVGGKRFSMNLGYVELPQVPALAQGAVLPANRPFLAMVGDQRSGTNIEAPLSTIEEAVANVLGGSLEGQDASNRLLAQILTAIENIRVGDDTIGKAARRYEQRMAVMGGVL